MKRIILFLSVLWIATGFSLKGQNVENAVIEDINCLGSTYTYVYYSHKLNDSIYYIVISADPNGDFSNNGDSIVYFYKKNKFLYKKPSVFPEVTGGTNTSIECLFHQNIYQVVSNNYGSG